MKTKQPAWFCVDNLGDVNPLEHGGQFLMIDRRGVYSPELWVWDPDKMSLHSIGLDRCHKTGNGVGENEYFPNYQSWFGDIKNIKSVCDSCGWKQSEFIGSLVNSDPSVRARAYYDIALTHGIENFDSEPEKYAEAEVFIGRLMRQIKESELWSDGLEK